MSGFFAFLFVLVFFTIKLVFGVRSQKRDFLWWEAVTGRWQKGMIIGTSKSFFLDLNADYTMSLFCENSVIFYMSTTSKNNYITSLFKILQWSPIFLIVKPKWIHVLHTLGLCYLSALISSLSPCSLCSNHTHLLVVSDVSSSPT